MSGKLIKSIVVLLMLVPCLWGRPNVIIIMTDDQGIGQLSFSSDPMDPARGWPSKVTKRYEGDPLKAYEAAQVAMPNLKRLSDDGVRFTNAWVASPICSPSRAAVLTGRYPQRYGIYSNDDAALGVDWEEVFLSSVFQEAGYATGFIGKWHVGKPTRVDLPVKTRDYHLNAIVGTIEAHHPLRRGFDYYFGFNRSGSSYYDPTGIFRNYDRVSVEGYLTEAFNDEAVRFIERSAASPFLLFVSYNAPHIPLHEPAPEKYLKRFDTGNPHIDNYYASLAAVDDGIGEILACLERLDLLSQTVVFFVSDNGAVIDSPLPMNGRFVGNKGLLSEGGLRVPFVVSYGGRFGAGSVRSNMVSAMDIFPTAIDLAELSEKAPENLDGISLEQILTTPRKFTEESRLLYWAGPDAYHWSPKNKKFWADYFAYVTGKEGELGDVPKSPYVEAYSDFAIAATDGSDFYKWEKLPAAEDWRLYGTPSSKKAEELFQGALKWLSGMKEPTRWAPKDYPRELIEKVK